MRKWLKRLALLIAGTVVVFAIALYVLYFYRAPLPAVAPHARVEPSITPMPTLSACWIETGKTFSNFSFGSTAGSILVRHRAGDLLIDTGNSSRFNDEIREFPFLTWLKLRFLAGQLTPSVPLPALLRRVGEDPSQLHWVILSHVHLDHAGGLMDLPSLLVLLSREELQYANDPAVQAKGYVIAAHTSKFPPPNAPTLHFAPKPYEIFDESADLYGDGSVVVVPLRGHTPGSVGIFVNLVPAKRLFYVGDAVDDERGFEQRVGKSLILRDSDNDSVRANEIVARLSELHKLLPKLAIIPAHGRSAYQKFFPAGPLTCVFGR
ncbi:MAG TPA: MBL fold metallo-hydrolase [Candidatus Methylomirabilis sp.]|nr:MBL fold metallo-hydrolase [Candidatus Methylomirabilis sp.]